MSRCIYKEIADKLDKTELEEYYKTHLRKDLCAHFNFDEKYFIRIFDYLGIKRRTKSENTIVQFKYYDQTERNKKVGKEHLGNKLSDSTKEKIRQKNKNKTVSIEIRKKISNSLKGHPSGNSGLKGVQTGTPEQRIKYIKTMAERGGFKKRETKIEKEIYNELINTFGENDVRKQYNQDVRYPFLCDFYVVSKDLFIEVNYGGHHGPHPYDPTNIEDQELVKFGENKANESQTEKEKSSYLEAIYNGTVRDFNKINTAKQNKIHYTMIYPTITIEF